MAKDNRSAASKGDLAGLEKLLRSGGVSFAVSETNEVSIGVIVNVAPNFEMGVRRFKGIKVDEVCLALVSLNADEEQEDRLKAVAEVPYKCSLREELEERYKQINPDKVLGKYDFVLGGLRRAGFKIVYNDGILGPHWMTIET